MTNPLLNSEQQRAVETTEGPVLIVAGAGSGKTRTIAERIKQLVRNGVSPSEILAITFTNKAAREMRERIETGIMNDSSINRPVSIAELPFVNTFHSLGVHILREHAALLGLRRQFAIFDKDDSRRAVKEGLQIAGLDPKTHDAGRILGIISREKGRGTTVDEYLEKEIRGYMMEVVAQIWPEYEKILRRDMALDFDDLLLKTERLLRENFSIREAYQKRWRYIHIDEYQDTNRVQYEISKMLVGESHNICVVGDGDQNIYSWRGAELKNILSFEKDYPETCSIILERNYRSTKNILEAANSIIEKNVVRAPKRLFTENDTGEKISLITTLDEEDEANFIAAEAKKIVGGGTPAEEIAVLYRANFQSRVLEESFMHLGIPYQLLGTRFFERKEVKDLISYLRAALNPESLADVKRIINVPARGLGKSSIIKIFGGEEMSLPVGARMKYQTFQKLLEEIEVVSREKKLSETINFIIKSSRLEEEWQNSGEEGEARLENAYELVNFASRYDDLPRDEAIEKFLTDSALQSDQDELENGKSGVRLMTVHAAKGLEFEVVFIAGLEAGLFPHERINEEHLTPEEAEEERRLFYVALTRAKKKVYLSYAQTRNLFGRLSVNLPSEFIIDIPEELIDEGAVIEY
ncbi:MAG TPA: UvrD-helicase domain-containing protein [Candidatus Paceibacterota bacterium]